MNAIKIKKSYQRRDFLKSSMAAAGAVGLLGACSSFPRRQPNSEQYVTAQTVYDFIVVGTGAGGAPLAARLATLGYSVLCIEAGRDEDDSKINVPSYHGISTEDNRWSWNYFVRHNQGNSAMDLKDTKFERNRGGILYPRASGIGGCTLHNAMITMYPDNKDWDYLAKISGDNSWSSHNMRKYFQRIEKNTYKFNVPKNWQTNGFKGWLSTTQTRLKFLFEKFGGDATFRKIIFASAGVWGLQNLEDLPSKDILYLDTNDYTTGPKPEGFYRVPMAAGQGKRSGPRELLLDVNKKYNLDIVQGALATKIIFKDNQKGKQIATGVECWVSYETPLYKASPSYDGEKASRRVVQTFKAKREVILAGGAFNSPQLLMLSGIGNVDELTNFGIRPLINLPGVGKNLQDRYEVGVVSELKSDYKSLKECTFTPEHDPCLEEYKKNPENHLYSSNGVVIGHMVRSRHSKKDEDPDLFVFAAPGDFRGYVTGWSKSATANKNRLTWAILKAKTSNTNGTVELKSIDPTDTPQINFNNFVDSDQDLESMLDGINFARSLNKQSPLSQMIKKEIWPAQGGAEAADRSFILKEAWGHHASCTCPMGHRITDGAVVDFDFKVHGTQNLRIVDASVFPKIPGHFIVTPIYMIAEKAADIIHRDNKA